MDKDLMITPDNYDIMMMFIIENIYNIKSTQINDLFYFVDLHISFYKESVLILGHKVNTVYEFEIWLWQLVREFLLLPIKEFEKEYK